MLYAKDSGLTSFSSLWSIKNALGTDKVGHTGTLDSFADGLLVVLTGYLTHLVPHITGFTKKYQAVVCFGRGTDSLDPCGPVTSAGKAPDREQLQAVLGEFSGALLQVPPVYSAVHVDGNRASDLVRSGKEFKLEPRQVFVYENRLVDFREASETDECSYALLEITCSKGTYIRALARDIAERLGTVAHVSALRRTQVGPFRLEDAACFSGLDEFTIDKGIANDIKFAPAAENLSKKTSGERKYDSAEKVNDIRSHFLTFTPELACFCGFDADVVKLEYEKAYLNGRPLSGSMFDWLPKLNEENRRLYGNKNEFAVFYSDMTFAGIVQRAGGKLSYGFVVPRKEKETKIFSWEDIIGNSFPLEWKHKGSAISVGSFDGIHLGHRALIDSVVCRKDYARGIVTFRKSYRALDDSYPGDVISFGQKMKILRNCGLDFIIVIDFSEDFSKMDGRDFMTVLTSKCGVKFLSEGKDFKCGFRGSMDMRALSIAGSEMGFALNTVTDVILGGEKISSSGIRSAVLQGDFSGARIKLGRAFAFDCTAQEFTKISSGRYRLESSAGQILPKDGLYNVSARLKSGKGEDDSVLETSCMVSGKSIELLLDSDEIAGRVREILFVFNS